MTKKKVYQEVKSKLLMAESEIRELKFAVNNAKIKLKDAVEVLDNIDTKIKY